MKKDIEQPQMDDLTIAIKLEDSYLDNHWTVHLINTKKFKIDQVLKASRGYGKEKGKVQKTSTLRHFYDQWETTQRASRNY